LNTQHEITVPSDLLDKRGELLQKGYATSPILKYNRGDVARKPRLKEWDYYLIQNDSNGVALTVGKTLSLALISATFFDFAARTQTTKTVIAFVPGNKLVMPLSSESGDIIFESRQVRLSIRHAGDDRQLKFSFNNFCGREELAADITLGKAPRDSMVIATPFYRNKKQFYYNQKIIGMRAAGEVRFGERRTDFTPQDSFGLLDWGRGVWPHKVTWYWSAAQGLMEGGEFGFNLGYGFGDTRAATENMLFYNGDASKLTDVKFHIPRKLLRFDYLKPWRITSSDRRIETAFEPILDRSVFLYAVLLSTSQHQVFGRFTGKAVLDGGRIIEIKDFFGFAERVKNRW
jgi:hypothetical protein